MRSGVPYAAALAIVGLLAAARLATAPRRPTVVPRDDTTTLVLVDLGGNGMSLTSPSDGVLLARPGRGAGPQTLRWAWTQAGADDAFLAVDSSRNGRIDGFSEVMGSIIALGRSAFDYLRDEADGYTTDEDWSKKNHARRSPDGRIDRRDAFYRQLILWTDQDHNGRSEEPELQALAFAGVESIDLQSAADSATDQFGSVIVARARATRAASNGAKTIDVLEIRLAKR